MSSLTHPHRRTFVQGTLAALGVSAMTPSQAGLLGSLFETKPSYPVTTSQLVFARNFGVRRIPWLDNDRVLLPADTLTTVKTPDGEEKTTRAGLGVYIWDVRKNSHTRHADLLDFGWRLYYDHGNIAYSIEKVDPNKQIYAYMVGSFGQEKRIVLNIGQGGIRPELMPSMGPGFRFRRDDGIDRSIYVMLPEHGYILTGSSPSKEGKAYPGNPDDSVKLYRPNDSQPIELPILSKETYAGAEFSYSEHIGKYVLLPAMSRNVQYTIRGRRPNWAKDESVPIYLISPDGQVETIEIPAGQRHPDQVFLTRAGLFWVSNQTGGNSREAGGWLLKDGKVTKLFDQLVDGAGVSPDGCTIVYAGNDFNPKTIDYVQAMDLCATK